MPSDRLRHRAATHHARHAAAAAPPSSPRRAFLAMDNSSLDDSAGRRTSRDRQQQQHEDDASLASASVASFLSAGSNGSGSRRGGKAPKKSPKKTPLEMEGIDEEQGYDRYERTSLLPGGGRGKGGGKQPKKHAKSKKKQRLRSISAGNDDDADDTKNNSDSDVRSRTLFLKTAFWITCWYGTSLATLFLNKIILSRPDSNVHILGMCQMTTAAVLGGWSTFGGAEYLQNAGLRMLRSLPENVQCRLGGGGRREGGAEKSRHSDSHPPPEGGKGGAPPAPDPGAPGGAVSYPFVRDMSIVGLLRGLTVVLGLVALEHVPVSFVETIKATAPAFTVLFARLILQERTATPVMLTLIPVIAGLVLCSASELRFDAVGFVAAVMNNCADCVQNVMSKRMLARLKPIQLQFYTSVAALLLQTPFVLRDAAGFVKNWAGQRGDDPDAFFAMPNTEDDRTDPPPPEGGTSLAKLLVIDAIFYHLQSVSAYCTMGCMSPVSQSVANTLKRALLVWASILYFGNPVTNSGVVGIFMVVSGVFLYNHVRRIYQS